MRTESFENNDDKKHEKKKRNVLDYDDLLPYSGSFGLYQTLMFFSTLPFYFFGVFSFYTQMFLTEVSSDHWCWVPELANLSIDERKRLAIPPRSSGKYGYDQCSVYAANWTEVLNGGDKPNASFPVVSCENGWEFDPTDIPYPTISSELGWVCDKKTYQGSAQFCFFVGSLLGGVLIGFISDRFGRIPALVVSNMFNCVFGVATTFAQSFVHFAVCRFFAGFAYDNCMMMSYLLLIEYIVPKYRTLVANISFGLFYAISSMSLPWIAKLCNNWKTLSVVTSLPSVIVLLAPCVLPESPRWLISKGRFEEAIDKLYIIARINKKTIPSEPLEQFREQMKANKEEASKEETFMTMLKHPVLRRMYLCALTEYMCIILAFDGLVRTISLLKYDFFISFTVMSFSELPSFVISGLLMDKLGRRWLTFICLLIGSCFSYATAFINTGQAAVAFAFIARLCINTSSGITFQWTAEILPAAVRGSGLAVIHACGNIISMIASYIVYTEIVAYWLPMVIIGTIALCAIFMVLALPETANKELPQTFQDSEDLTKNHTFFYVPCLTKNNNNRHKGQENNAFEM